MGALRELGHRLELPLAARGAFLAEVTGDLEALYDELRARGLGPAAAWRVATEVLLPDETALRELTSLHRPIWVRWAEGLTGSGVGWRTDSSGGSGAVEAAMVVALTAVVLSSILFALLNGGVLAPLSWALVPVMAAGGATSILIAGTALQVWWRGEPRADRVRLGARRIAAAGGLTLAVGALAAGVGFAQSVNAAGTNVGVTAVLLAWIPTAVAKLSLALVVVLECGVVWLLLAGRAARLEADVARAMARVRGFHFPGAGS